MNRSAIIILCRLLFVFASHATFAQQQDKDSVPEYMKKFRYYRLPGQPDSATFFRRMDSLDQRNRRRDSLYKRYDSLRRLHDTPAFNPRNVAYNSREKQKPQCPLANAL